jgi:hypothetical protein
MRWPLMPILATLVLCAWPSTGQAQSGAFDEGSWTLAAYGSYAEGFRLRDDQLGTATVSVGYYFADRWSINAEGVYFKFDEPTETDAVGGNVIFRWHFLARDRYSLYLDFGGGMLDAQDEIPAGGTEINFDARAGLGATIRLLDDLHLMGGVHYFHLSNGNIHGLDENPSIDAIEGYVGLMLTF